MATSNNKQQKTDDGYKLSLKVSPKGAVQLDGLRRFPATFYQDEWEAILSRADAIRKFIADNKKDLRAKVETEASKGGTSI